MKKQVGGVYLAINSPPRAPQRHQGAHKMLSETEIAIARQMGVSEAQLHARLKPGQLFNDADSGNFGDNRSPGAPMLPAASTDDHVPDVDGGIPASSDDSVRAHAKRAMNHIEYAMDDDAEIDMSRLQAARDCLNTAIERRGSMGRKAVAIRFEK